MNIFILDLNHKLCAQYHCDKHVVKMIIEYTQILSTVCRLGGLEVGYNITHKNHPCVIWARKSEENWLWLYKLAEELSKEYTYRYNRTHASSKILRTLLLPELPKIGLTDFYLAMPEKYKSSDPVKSYRDYYIGEKLKFAKWKEREEPSWIVDS